MKTSTPSPKRIAPARIGGGSTRPSQSAKPAAAIAVPPLAGARGAAAIVALALAPAAVAQDFLAPLVVTAGRSETALPDTAYTSHVIDAESIADRNRRTLPEALQFTPGVLVQKTTHGHGSPFIRGFTGRQNLVLIDGVRFNNSLFRGGPVQYWNTIDSWSIDRLELIKSQGSVLYGSDAIGGTANVFTQSSDFRDFVAGEAFHHGSAAYEYRGNGDDSHVGRIESGFGVGGEFGVMLGVTAKDFGDIRGPAVGLMRNTGYTEEDLDLKLEFAVSPTTTMTFLHQYVNQDDIWRWHSTRFNPGWAHDGSVAAPGSFDSRIHDQERSLTYLRLAGEDPAADAWLSRWSATVSYQTTRDREVQDRSPTDRRYQVAEVDTLGFDLSLESDLGEGTWVYGLDYYHDEVDAFGLRDRGAGLALDPSFRPVADGSEYDLFGAYAQYVWRPSERFELTGGGRYTHARAELGRFFDASLGSDRFGASRDWDDFSGSLRALYHLDACWTVYGGLSQAFRAPNLTDLSGNLTTRSGTASAGSINVEPEEFVTYEIGSRFGSDDAYLNFAGFYTDVSDVITSVATAPGGGATVTTNGQDGEVYGLELEGRWRFHPDWTLSGFAAWQDGETETNAFVGGPVISDSPSRLLPLSGSLALRWDSPERRYWIEGRVLAAARQDDLSLRDQGDTQRIPVGGTPGYAVLSAHAGWRVSESLELNLGLENLTNEDYRIHGSGQNETGFGAIVRAKVIW
jgi:hemoglobin/transferrin/lactoferrin receptor protein